MTWMEKNGSSNDAVFELRAELKRLLSERYESLVINTEHGTVECFRIGQSGLAWPAVMLYKGDSFIVMQYAADEDEVKKAWEEDGAVFDPGDYASKEELFKAIFMEIEGN